MYCPAGDFYIDPWRPVDRAVITHAHADHARTGHGHYLAAQDSAHVLRSRLGAIDLQTLAYGEAITIAKAQNNTVALASYQDRQKKADLLARATPTASSSTDSPTAEAVSTETVTPAAEITAQPEATASS